MRGMGITYLAAFISLWVQLSGLIGAEGISPASEVLDGFRAQISSSPDLSVWHFPTVFWLLGGDDAILHLVAGMGCLSAVLLVLGWSPRLSLIILWLTYLSFFTVTQPFLGFQWDILLLESSLLAIFYAPSGLGWTLPRSVEPPRWMVWALRFLLFKLIVSSGLVKLASGDSSWQDLSALDHHFWTQPLPHGLAWWAHHMPGWTHQIGVLFNHFVELCVPFIIIFNPRGRGMLLWTFLNFTALSHWGQAAIAWCGSAVFGLGDGTAAITLGHCIFAALSAAALGGRIWPQGAHSHGGRPTAAAFISALMLSVAASGNYGFFNLLTIVLCIPLMDDLTLRKWLWFSRNTAPGPPVCKGHIWTRLPALTLVTTLSVLSAIRLLPLFVPFEQNQGPAPSAESQTMAERLAQQIGEGQRRVDRWARRYAAVNGYGLFARMTKNRFELQIEGSADGQIWKPYRFRYKPNTFDEMPAFAGLHMPRLDWQLWFSALRPRCSERWFFRFLERLSRGAEPVLELLDDQPFPAKPPRYLRVNRFSASFSLPGDAGWWIFEPAAAYCPQVEAHQLKAVLGARRP